MTISKSRHTNIINHTANHIMLSLQETYCICGLWRQKQVFRAWISNDISQYSDGCNYLSMPQIPAFGANVLIYCHRIIAQKHSLEPLHPWLLILEWYMLPWCPLLGLLYWYPINQVQPLQVIRRLRASRFHLLERHFLVGCSDQGVVSQTFLELFKIISWKYTMPEITFIMSSKVKLCMCAQSMALGTWLWAHVQNISLKFSQEVGFLQHMYINFKRIYWRARGTLVKHPPRPHGIFGQAAIP